jgi:hypothetical protein
MRQAPYGRRFLRGFLFSGLLLRLVRTLQGEPTAYQKTNYAGDRQQGTRAEHYRRSILRGGESGYHGFEWFFLPGGRRAALGGRCFVFGGLDTSVRRFLIACNLIPGIAGLVSSANGFFTVRSFFIGAGCRSAAGGDGSTLLGGVGLSNDASEGVEIGGGTTYGPGSFIPGDSVGGGLSGDGAYGSGLGEGLGSSFIDSGLPGGLPGGTECRHVSGGAVHHVGPFLGD